jgi:Leucine-rich repeat (LRR) protein
LAKIAKLSHLSKLWLRHTPKVTDGGIRHLEHLPIADLDLWGDHVTDKCIDSILAMDYLERLVLRETYITDQALDALQKARRLKSLSIYQTNITDAGLQFVGQMRNLEHLDIRCTPVSDVGLTYLNNLNKLTSLDLAGCPNISAAAIDAFKKARPTCKVDVKTL